MDVFHESIPPPFPPKASQEWAPLCDIVERMSDSSLGPYSPPADMQRRANVVSGRGKQKPHPQKPRTTRDPGKRIKSVNQGVMWAAAAVRRKQTLTWWHYSSRSPLEAYIWRCAEVRLEALAGTGQVRGGKRWKAREEEDVTAELEAGRGKGEDRIDGPLLHGACTEHALQSEYQN
ncbi:hypothetical protein B7494_g7686 [Chlorociboria aeruginascens]|nr:hypothetical protein B7494_g7686 [Chlorociboria aeruginascens]